MKCEWFGHKWQEIYIRKDAWKFIAVFCQRCRYGHQEIANFVDKHSPIINSYDEKYW